MKRDIFEEMMAHGTIMTAKAAIAKAYDGTFDEMVESLRESKLSDSEIYDLLVYMDEQTEAAISKAIDRLDV